jgi:hypothetical protein
MMSGGLVPVPAYSGGVSYQRQGQVTATSGSSQRQRAATVGSGSGQLPASLIAVIHIISAVERARRFSVFDF